MYAIRSYYGEVQLTKTLAEKEYDLLVLSRGHFVGEYGMLMREKSVFTSVTKTPVAAVKIDKDVFAKSLKRDPTLQSTLFMNMTTKFNLYNQGIEKIIKDLEEGNPKQAVEQPKKAPIEEEKSTVKEEHVITSYSIHYTKLYERKQLSFRKARYSLSFFIAITKETTIIITVQSIR